MNNTEKLLKIYFCFPENVPVDDVDGFVGSLTKEVRSNDLIGYAGFKQKKSLQKAIKNNYRKEDIVDYKPLSDQGKKVIRKHLKEVVLKCNAKLPLPQKPLYIHTFPWFPSKDAKIFEGVMGTAIWENSIHILIDTKKFSVKALGKIIAHEYNHMIFYNYHPKNERAIWGAIIMEGLAEHFREDIVGGEPAPWSTALDKKEVERELKKIQDHNLSQRKLKNDPQKYWKFHREVFYGEDDKYKRWTGYSIGYQIVEAFKEKESDITWEELMKLDTEEIMESGNI